MVGNNDIVLLFKGSILSRVMLGKCLWCFVVATILEIIVLL